MSAHRVAEPDFKERVEESFGRQAAMKLIGAELARCEPVSSKSKCRSVKN